MITVYWESASVTILQSDTAYTIFPQTALFIGILLWIVVTTLNAWVMATEHTTGSGETKTIGTLLV